MFRLADCDLLILFFDRKMHWVLIEQLSLVDFVRVWPLHYLLIQLIQILAHNAPLQSPFIVNTTLSTLLQVLIFTLLFVAEFHGVLHQQHVFHGEVGG